MHRVPNPQGVCTERVAIALYVEVQCSSDRAKIRMNKSMSSCLLFHRTDSKRMCHKIVIAGILGMKLHMQLTVV